ncbi:MAG: DUF4167 domain-containing protein [Alphaproteobacteria bacterium]|nr:DUF4167 domain-containing protein [Alphaproteobacteria bacterium]
MNNKRSRGRGHGGHGHNNNGKKHMPMRPQTFDSNGPDIRVRGNAHQVLEKYLQLARDAQAAGDRIAAENFYQHAEHYYRVINSMNQQAGQQQRRPMMSTPADDQPHIGDENDGEGEGEQGVEAQGEATVEPIGRNQPVEPVSVD